jgi:hypothetical protein
MRLISNISVWVSLLLVCFAFFPLLLFAERQDFFEGLNAICMALGAGVLFGYGRASWKTMRAPIHSVKPEELLVVGIVVCSFSVVGIFGGLWLWRALHKPDYIIDSGLFAFTRYLFAFGAFTVLVSAQSNNGSVNGNAYGKAGLVVAGAVLAAAILISLGLP